MFKKRKIAKSSLAQQSTTNDKRREEPLPTDQDATKSSPNDKDNRTKSNQNEDFVQNEEPVVVKKNQSSKSFTYTSASKPSTKMTLPNTIYSSSAPPSDSNEVSNDKPATDTLPTSTSSTTPVAKFSSGSKYGPSKSSASIKATTMTDYAPDVCKDYKQNGYCGFGDTCKFLHIREDYAAGWKLDKEWEEQQLRNREKRANKTLETGESKDEQNNVVTTCPICKSGLKFPVFTKECGHVFCEKCFLDEYRKKKNCKVCGVPLSGIVTTYKEGMKIIKTDLKEEKSEKDKLSGFKRKSVPV